MLGFLFVLCFSNISNAESMKVTYTPIDDDSFTAFDPDSLYVPDDFFPDYDDKGRVITGNYCITLESTAGSGLSYRKFYWQAEFASSGGLCILHDTSATNYTSKYYVASKTAFSGNGLFGKYLGDYSTESQVYDVKSSTSSLFGLYVKNICLFTSFPVDKYQLVNFSTNIPVFDINDEAAIMSYFDDGSFDGAENEDTVHVNPNQPTPDIYDGSVPLPHNLRVLQGADQSVVGDASTTVGTFSKDVVLAWEQSDVVDGLTYEIQFQSYAKRMPDDGQLTLQEHWSPYNSIVKDTYNGSKSITVSIDTSTLNNYKEKGFLTKQKFRVRNSVNGNTSNWVVVTIDIEKGTATATEEGYADDTQGGDEYNDTSVGGDTGVNIDGNISVDGIMSYVRDGFGLLGNGGIISLMSSTFLYLPGSTWTIFNFFVSSLVVIAMIGAVVKIIF